MILLIDNYDSFSYNLYQIIGELNPDIKVIRNDEMTVDEIRDLNPDCIILSPGPGRPEDAGVIVDVVKTLSVPDYCQRFSVGNFKRNQDRDYKKGRQTSRCGHCLRWRRLKCNRQFLSLHRRRWCKTYRL